MHYKRLMKLPIDYKITLHVLFPAHPGHNIQLLQLT